MADYYVSQGGSRILNATRVDQSSADNANVIDWVKTNDFIIAININSNGKDTEAAQYKLRWRNKTDVGSFADVASTGAINYSATTDLVNGNPIAVGGRKCDSQGGDTWAAGEEVEGASLSDSIDLADEYETEIHFALDCSGATDEKEYEFELYDSTLGVTRGTCGATITMAAGAAEGWLSGWAYRKEITITGQSGAGTNYQVLLDIGDSAGGDFHLEGNCTNFPEDIEVTDNDGETLLKFWIPDKTTDPIEMWVKVADDLGTNQTIYIYYGKSGATTNSNIGDTMVFGDEFDVDKTKWTGDTTELTISGGTGLFNAGTAALKKISSTSSFTLPYIIESSIKRPANATNRATSFGLVITTDEDMIKLYYDWGINNEARFEKDDAGRQEITTDISVGVVEKNKIVGESSSSIRWYFDDVEGLGSPYTNSTHIITASSPITFETYGTENFELYWVFARKYNSTEPAFSSAGSEETPTAGVSPTAVFYGPLVGPLGGPI